jgi:hypothetical protein
MGEKKTPRMAEDDDQTATWVLVGFVIAIFVLALVVIGVLLYKEWVSARFDSPYQVYRKERTREENEPFTNGEENRSISISPETYKKLVKRAKAGSQSRSGDKLLYTRDSTI